MAQPVGRLAPSPTGAQHVGNARTYLIAWLSIRSRSGRLRLRIEDIDSPRIKPGAAEQALEDLRWLGLDWDDIPVVQTSRLPLYEQALGVLQSKELVYPCTCTRSDIENAASAPHAEHEGPAYPGTCAHRRASDAVRLEGRAFAWRFRSQPGFETFHDGFRGRAQSSSAQGGDFVVWKSSATPAYQLAVVVDDADMGVTEVVRGDDLIPSTPRQLQLYESLGHNPPAFVHVPLVVGPNGRRLAKRHGDTRLATLRQQGVQPQTLVGWLAWSCGWIEKPRPVQPHDLLSLFRLDRVPAEPWVLIQEQVRQMG